MCDAHSSGKALLSWRLANGDFSQKTIICVQHCDKIQKKKKMVCNTIKAKSDQQKCSF